MVGFLLALNAMLLTVPERRRFVADLRMQGYDWRQILVLLGFQALSLGARRLDRRRRCSATCSRARFFHRIPAYLIDRVPDRQPGGAARGHGRARARLRRARDAARVALAGARPAPEPPHRRGLSRPRRAAARCSRSAPRRDSRCVGVAADRAGHACSCCSTPSLTIFGGVALALATLCLIPALFAGVARVLRWAGERVRSSALIIVVSELRAITMRSVALAGIAALAVYGSVAIGGARADLVRGLDANFSEYLQHRRGVGDDRRQRPDDEQLRRRRAPARPSRARPGWQPCASTRAASSTSARGACGSSRGPPAIGR